MFNSWAKFQFRFLLTCYHSVQARLGSPKGGLDESIQAFWADTTVARLRVEEVGMTR